MNVFRSLPDAKNIDLSKLKALEENELNVMHMSGFTSERAKMIVEMR